MLSDFGVVLSLVVRNVLFLLFCFWFYFMLFIFLDSLSLCVLVTLL